MAIYAGKITIANGETVGVFASLGVTPGAFEVVLASFQGSNGALLFHSQDDTGDNLGVPIATAGAAASTYPDAVSRYVVDGDEFYITNQGASCGVGVSLFSRPPAGPTSATFSYS